MGSGSKFLVLAAVIIVAFILQIVLIGVGRHESPPGEVAVDFSKAYFYLDADMGDMLCADLTGDEDTDVVDDYIHRVAAEARAEGFDRSWKKMTLSHVDLKTEMVDENTAKIQISGERRRSINPVYAVVARIFCLGDTYKVEETLTVVKEEDGWKVCGQPYDLTES